MPLNPFVAPTPTAEFFEDRENLARSVVYFISTTARDHPIKIGTSTQARLSYRFTQLQIAMPYLLEVLVVRLGGVAEERELHDRFSRLHLRGEWFNRGNALLQYIGELQRETPDWDLKYLDGRRWRDATSRRERFKPKPTKWQLAHAARQSES